MNATEQTRSSSADYIYAASAAGMDNLKVYTQTLAKKVLFNGKKANGVEVDSLGVNYNIKARQEVILSAGAFQSPQLLMVSGIGPKATLKQHSIPGE
jgi:choline dehydrogenase-like flavoprotein